VLDRRVRAEGASMVAHRVIFSRFFSANEWRLCLSFGCLVRACWCPRGGSTGGGVVSVNATAVEVVDVRLSKKKRKSIASAKPLSGRRGEISGDHGPRGNLHDDTRMIFLLLSQAVYGLQAIQHWHGSVWRQKHEGVHRKKLNFMIDYVGSKTASHTIRMCVNS
jgi:hypothetical protein